MTRILLAVLIVGAATSAALAQYTAPRVPLGILITNWDCDPCAPANQLLDAWYPTVGDDYALIRVHCWWPGPFDPIYRDNIEQSEYLIWDTPNGPDSAPHLWVDNVVNAGTYAEPMVGFLEDRARVPAPLVIDLAWDAAAGQVTATVDVLDEIPAGEYRLFVAVTEDSVAAEGSNGEPFHNQAFRHLFPSVGGMLVAAVTGQQVFQVPTPLSDRWDHDQLRLTAFVQSRDTGEVQNAATVRLADLATAAPDLAVAGIDVRAYPNPFNPMTRLTYRLAGQAPVFLRIHDLRGRVVRTLVDAVQPAGPHEVTWDGRDQLGSTVPSGVYLAQLRAGATLASRKLMLAR